MKKKVFIGSLVLIFGVISLIYLKSFKPKEKGSFCPFCDEKVINYQKYFEDEFSIGLCSYKPLLKGHSLIIPKRHVERLEDLTDREMQNIFNLIKKTNLAVQKVLGNKSYIVIQKNGKEVGQSVFHAHFHYIPRVDNGSNFGFLTRFSAYPFKRKLNPNEMQDIKEMISQNI
ncbi:MAG: AP-4-A phosphorylase [Candidatus Anoxychlamydiales bacterium]|nr:AP-4-A phosphorylase [Candidatus Anoxychlamydiales bacterium]NGX41458.1 AP-4-A phosphorylase [Candidatus Anoxychlamydiales bacterium]HEU64668.1 HIT family protein [Chlamydiota bacterium]